MISYQPTHSPWFTDIGVIVIMLRQGLHIFLCDIIERESESACALQLTHVDQCCVSSIRMTFGVYTKLYKRLTTATISTRLLNILCATRNMQDMKKSNPSTSFKGSDLINQTALPTFISFLWPNPSRRPTADDQKYKLVHINILYLTRRKNE